MKPTFYVYNPATGYTNYQHQNLDSAMREAERLARLHPYERFQVLEAIGECRKQDITWQTVEKRMMIDELPF